MTLEELIDEMGDNLRETGEFLILRKHFTQSIHRDNLTKWKVVEMVRAIRNDMLLWCDDIISFANEES